MGGGAYQNYNAHYIPCRPLRTPKIIFALSTSLWPWPKPLCDKMSSSKNCKPSPAFGWDSPCQIHQLPSSNNLQLCSCLSACQRGNLDCLLWLFPIHLELDFVRFLARLSLRRRSSSREKPVKAQIAVSSTPCRNILHTIFCFASSIP